MRLSEEQWAKIAPWIEDALAEGMHTHSVADVRAKVECGECMPLIGERCVVILACVPQPQVRILNVWLAGGEKNASREEVLSLWPGIKAIGRTFGCNAITVDGRAAWGRLIKDEGWREISRSYGMRL